MKILSKLLFNCAALACMPFVANAAGTYYTGGYQSPQTRYGQTNYQQQGYTQQASRSTLGPTTGYSASGYSRYGQTVTQQRVPRTTQNQQQSASNSSKKGFYLDAGISRETAQWEFEMNEAGSKLHYDNISWNVFDVNAGYNFNIGKTAARVEAGGKYGIQGGESSMVDDDITNGGYFVTQWVDSGNNVLGDQLGHALSAGTSKDGSMFGFNVGFGLPDFFQLGKTKITPSVGWRYFKYKLETKNNYGLAMDTLSSGCIHVNGETQCDPLIIVYYYDSNNDKQQQIIFRNNNGEMEIAPSYDYIDTGGTYYYKQPGVSHSYEVAWSGPYLALDMDYEINQNNAVNARVELGLPSYSAEGDQPYRFDWQHPKSVEDEGGLGSALHFGLGANWKTAITDNIMLTIGLTYDYYTVSDADAKTYLNSDYYLGIYNNLLAAWVAGGFSEADMLDPVNGDPTALNIVALENACPGWVCKTGSEIESFYKSMGIRVGISAKF